MIHGFQSSTPGFSFVFMSGVLCKTNQCWTKFGKRSVIYAGFSFLQPHVFVFPFYVFMSGTQSFAKPNLGSELYLQTGHICVFVLYLYSYLYLYLYKVLCKTKFGEWAVFPNEVNRSFCLSYWICLVFVFVFVFVYVFVFVQSLVQNQPMLNQIWRVDCVSKRGEPVSVCLAGCP